MIDAAVDLFHLQGVKGTSVDEVLAKSATGKGQFTHYFRTKDSLVHAVLQHLHEAIQGGFTPTGYDVRTWEDLDRWFARYLEFQRSVNLERSCPIGTIGNDVHDQQPLLRQDVRLFFEWARGTLGRFFAERRAAGELPPESDPDALADLCLTVMQGGMLITKITRSTRTFENAARQALAFVGAARVRPGTRRRTPRARTTGGRRPRPG
jgi:TetR/AcrR family transcriptional regulator, transcriptional repressor for nem operon